MKVEEKEGSYAKKKMLTPGEIICANSVLFFPKAISEAVVPYCRRTEVQTQQ